MNMIDGGNKKRIYIGADHAGFEAKDAIKEYLEGKGLEVIDLGCFSEDPCDYPDIGREIGEKVAENIGSFGVAICGSGVGVTIAANKMPGIRAALVVDDYFAEQARQHNDANVIGLAARYSKIDDMKRYVDKFLDTEFESGEERRVRRVEKLNTM